MNRIKKFSFFIKESIDITEDMFLEFKELGYDVSIANVYAKDMKSLKSANVYHDKSYNNEIATKKIMIYVDGSNMKMDLKSYIDHLQELTSVLEILENRLNSKAIIEVDPNMTIILVEGIEEIDNSDVVNDLKQIKEYLEKKFVKKASSSKNFYFHYRVELNEENMTLSIMDVHNDAGKITPIFRTKEFKELNKTASKLIFDKRRYSVPLNPDNPEGMSTLHFKLVSRIKGEMEI